jgi:hypothetical protein
MSKYGLIIFLFLSSVFNIDAQSRKHSKHEFKKFMQFIRTTEFKDTDTLFCRNYLCNKGLFQGMPLSGVGRDGLSEEEKVDLINQSKDTSKSYFNKKLMDKTVLVNGIERSCWQFSKPIFLRSYLLCVFSFAAHFDANTDYQKTFIYKKERGKWYKLFEIGAIKNY